jgi:hypothetical protein
MTSKNTIHMFLFFQIKKYLRLGDFYYLGLFIIVGLVFFTSCRKEQFNTDPEVTLRFSSDTLRFDTVFTSRGSATRSVKVFNDYNEYIKISTVRISGNFGGRFRINVDGISGNPVKDVVIPPGDSIYLFAEVTVDPDLPLSSSPYVIEDQIIFEVNGRESVLHMEAWGQNANYIPNRFNQGQLALLSCGMGEISWDDPRPYVVYGILFIDSCTLKIPAGTQIYIHGGFGTTPDNVFYNDGMLFFLEHGRLQIHGEIDKPVTIQGDRLEPEFANVPGQWAGIRFLAGSRGPHLFRNVNIRNAIFGIYADSACTVELDRVCISNTSSVGIAGIRATINASNSLFFDNYGGGANLLFGGNYTFTHCTFSNDGLSRETLNAQTHICRNADCSLIELFPLQLQLRNCIFHNAARDVINFTHLRQELSGFFNYQITNCALRVDDLVRKVGFTDIKDRCVDCTYLLRNDRIFLKPSSKDFTLDTMSVVRGKGLFLPAFSTDKKGNARNNPPDLGCFEFID